jgi:hypothetical protein
MAHASYVESARTMAHILINWPGFTPPPWPTFAPPLTPLGAAVSLNREPVRETREVLGRCRYTKVQDLGLVRAAAFRTTRRRSSIRQWKPLQDIPIGAAPLWLTDKALAIFITKSKLSQARDFVFA